MRRGDAPALQTPGGGPSNDAASTDRRGQRVDRAPRRVTSGQTHRRGHTLSVVLALATGLVVSAVPAAAVPGMCLGMTSTGLHLMAQVNGATVTPGRGETSTVVMPASRGSLRLLATLNVDPAGVLSGHLLFEQSGLVIRADSWCRAWTHTDMYPGEGVPGGAEDVVHAVGIGSVNGGATVLVRIDARKVADAAQARVRYKALSGGEQVVAQMVAAAMDEGHGEDEGWIRVPVEGWLPLDVYRLSRTPRAAHP